MVPHACVASTPPYDFFFSDCFRIGLKNLWERSSDKGAPAPDKSSVNMPRNIYRFNAQSDIYPKPVPDKKKRDAD